MSVPEPPTSQTPGSAVGEAVVPSGHRRAGVLRSVLVDVGYVVGAVVVLLGIWQLAVTVGSIPAYLLPPPLDVLTALRDEADQLWDHSLVTAWESILAFLLAVVVGGLLGVVIAFVRPVAKVLYPLLIGSNAIPKVALAPLFLVWLGFGLSSKVVIGFTIAFFPVVINTVAGLRAVPPGMIELARATGGGGWKTFRKIRVPYALPSFFAGLKVAISLAVVGAIVGEFVGSDKGLGYVLIVTGSQLNSPLLYAALLALTIVAVVLYLAVEVAEIALRPGRRTRTR